MRHGIHPRTPSLDGELGSLATFLERVAEVPGATTAEILEIAADDPNIELTERIGAGGMGVVYLARDKKLDRQVAVKLQRLGGGDAAERLLLDEARAMARLAHPNVVTVYDVRELGGHLVLLMEYVPGKTLDEWLSEPRERDEILEIFAAAGEGLAAAHEAGLVHRDFKPSNVIVGEDGRVRVADFGLALINAADGGLAGTPAYMAPEQRAGGAIDARADQYAFCRALDEALAGAAPPWLEAAVARGLRPEPGDRFASMGELLAALERRPAPQRRLLVPYAAALVLVVIAATAALAMQRGGEPALSCAEATAEALGDAWSPERRRALVAGFVESGAERAAPRAEAVAAELDRYAARWRRSWQNACRAVSVDRTWPDDLGALARRCLERQRSRLNELAGALEHPDAAAVSAAYDAVTRLPPPRACGDADYLRSRIAPPADPAVAAEVARAEKRFEALSASLSLGHVDRVSGDLPALRGEAQRLDHDPLTGSVQFLEGAVAMRRGDYRKAIDLTHRAYLTARRSRDVELAAETAARLVWLHGYFQNDFDAGEQWAQLAAVEIESMPRSPAALAVHQAVGVLAEHRGQGERAVAVQRQALELAESLRGRDHYVYANALQNLAGALEVSGKSSEAMALLRQAIPLIARAFGDDSIQLANALSYLGVVEQNAGDGDAARESAKRALAIARAAGAGDLDLGSIELNLGAVLLEAGDHAASLEPLESARRRLEAGGDSALAALAQSNAGQSRAALALLRGDADLEARAISDLEAAASTLGKTWGADHPDRAEALSALAALHAGRGRCPEALPLARQALAIGEAAKLPAASDPLVVIGRCLLATRPEEARRSFERALALRRAAGANPLAVAEVNGWLGVALSRGGEGERGQELVDRAGLPLEAAGGQWAQTLASIRAALP